MCISSKASIFTFIFSIISSIILIFYGNTKFKDENLISGLLMIYVAFMQIFDYFIWIDLNNEKGYNKIASQLAAFFNYTQPLVIYIFSYIVYSLKYSYSISAQKLIVNFKKNIYIGLINLLYFIYFLINYYKFLNSKEVITYLKDGHLKWNWSKYFNIWFYLLLLLINLWFVFTNIKYLLIIIFFIFGTLIFSYIKFNNNIGELWCYIFAYFPLLLCYLTYLI